METIPTEALLELRFMLEQSIDVQFQVWMAATFAVMVAVYSARKDLTLNIRVGIAVIYSLAVAALFFRWVTEGIRISQLIEPELLSRGVDSDIIRQSGLFRILTFWSGSFATLISIFYFKDEPEILDKENQNV